MMDPRLPYIIPFAVAALGILTVAVVVLHHRRVRGGSFLFCLCLSAALWAVTEGLLYFGFSKDVNVLITKIQYLGIATLPPLALMMAFVTFGLTSATTRIVCNALFAMAGLIVMHDVTRRKRLENKLKQMAATDPLTGVANRRHLFELADREYYRQYGGFRT